MFPFRNRMSGENTIRGHQGQSFHFTGVKIKAQRQGNLSQIAQQSYPGRESFPASASTSSLPCAVASISCTRLQLQSLSGKHFNDVVLRLCTSFLRDPGMGGQLV
jgi:hypothetical protein